MATLAQLMRYARQGNTPVAEGSTYNPMAYAYTLEQALAPTGIQTAYGDPYVGSRWTRFTEPDPSAPGSQPAGMPAVTGFANARNQAFIDWANKVGSTLGGVQFQQTGSGSAPYAATFKLPEGAATVSLYQYDDWTKNGIDPAAAVRQMAAGGFPVAASPAAATGTGAPASALARLAQVSRSVGLAARLRDRRGR